MPRYELAYILSSGVSDDQTPEVTGSIAKIVSDFGGAEVQEEQLGKKKLAYPIKGTRNGHYVALTFNMESSKINDLDAKIRTQGATIIRYMIVNLDEHLERMSKDKIEQSKITRRIPQAVPDKETPTASKVQPVTINAEELDRKIEEALTEDITK
jgi:small subunit ribosomal protein S6